MSSLVKRSSGWIVGISSIIASAWMWLHVIVLRDDFGCLGSVVAANRAGLLEVSHCLSAPSS